MVDLFGERVAPVAVAGELFPSTARGLRAELADLRERLRSAEIVVRRRPDDAAARKKAGQLRAEYLAAHDAERRMGVEELVARARAEGPGETINGQRIERPADNLEAFG